MRLYIVLLFTLSMFLQLGGWGVIDPTESRYAEIAREMVLSGDYIHPTYLAIQHYHKPPVTYYLTCLGYYILGINSLGARFFLQIALLLQLFLIYKISLDIFESRRIGISAAAIYASFLLVWISAKSLSADAYLCTLVAGSTWALVRYAKTGKPIYLYTLALISGIGFMTKITAFLVYLGPISIGVFLHFKKEWRWSIHLVPALLLFVMVSLAWFIQLETEGKPVLKYMMVYQSVVRYATDEFRRNQPVYFYLIVAIILCFPWFLISLISWIKNNPFRKFIPLFAFGVLIPILFFSFSHSKLILYILPTTPLLAIYGAYYLEKLSEKATSKWLFVQISFSLLLLLLIMIFPFIFPEYESHILIYVFGCVALILLVVHNINTKIALKDRLILSSLVTVLMINLIGSTFLKRNEIRIQSVKPLVEWLEKNDLSERNIYIYNKIAPGVAFHLNKLTIQLEDDTKAAKRETEFQEHTDWLNYYYEISQPGEITRLLQTEQNLFVVLSRNPDFPDRYPDIMNRLNNSYQMDKWFVYY